MSQELAFVDGRVVFSVDLRIYRLAAVKKAAYRLADRCTAILGSPVDDQLTVSLLFKGTTTESQALELARVFFEQLTDEELRAEIADETGTLRALILAQAFSKTNLIRPK